MANFLPFYKCRLILRSYQTGWIFFVRVWGKYFVIIKFVTDFFTNNISSIVVTPIKLVSIRSLQIFNFVVSIYIRYRCFLEISVIKKMFVRIFLGGDCQKYSDLSGSFVNKWINKSTEVIFFKCSVENCGDKLSTYWIILFRSNKLQAISKAIYLSENSGRFIKCEDILATSHTPQLLASNCFCLFFVFFKKKWDSKVACEFTNIIFVIWIEVGSFVWSQRSESMWVILFSLILTIWPWKSTSSQRGIQIRWDGITTDSGKTWHDFWGNVHRRRRTGLIFRPEFHFFTSFNRSWDVWFNWYLTSCCYLQINLQSKINHITCYLPVILHTLSTKYHQLKN